MTTTANRPTTRRTTPEPPTAVGMVAATVTAACTAAALGLLAAETLVLLAWASDSRSAVDALPAAKAGALAWLLAHGAPVSIPGGVLSVAPLGLTLVLALLLARAGATAVRRHAPSTVSGALLTGAGVGVPYSLLAALVTGPAALAGARPAPVATMVAALALGGVAGGMGAAREVGTARVLLAVPAPARAVGRAAGVALLALVVTGAVATAGSLLTHAGRADRLAESLQLSVASGVMLIVVSVVLSPVAVVWAAAYSLGTGFAIGAGTSVAPTGVRLGPLPSLPMLAALPGEGDAPTISLLLLAGPLVAAVLAGLTVVRRLPGRTPAVLSAHGLAAGVAAGAVVLVVCVLAAGGIGSGRLSTAGPSPWLTALAAAEWIGLGGAATAYLAARRATD
ncbi:MAG TPA: DUF6350 family protein [Mycobacteriales bacterium]|nr:DUF6350 family protein [Mycobacteriales bacterium]